MIIKAASIHYIQGPGLGVVCALPHPVEQSFGVLAQFSFPLDSGAKRSFRTLDVF